MDNMSSNPDFYIDSQAEAHALSAKAYKSSVARPFDIHFDHDVSHEVLLSITLIERLQAHFPGSVSLIARPPSGDGDDGVCQLSGCDLFWDNFSTWMEYSASKAFKLKRMSAEALLAVIHMKFEDPNLFQSLRQSDDY